MGALAIIVEAMLPVFVMLGAGAALRRLKWLSPSADSSLLALTVNLLTPCLILDKVLGSASLARASTLLLAPTIAFTVVVSSIALAYAAARAARVPSGAERRTFAFTTGIQNYGYFPLPLALSLYGDETAAVLFVHNLGAEAAIWTIGIVVLSGAPAHGIVRRLASPPAVAIVAAAALNLTVGRAGVPAFALESLRVIGAAAIPLGLLLTGATMMDHARELAGRLGLRTVFLAVALRLGLLPLLYCAALWLLEVTVELQRVFVLQAAMPSAVMPIILAKYYGGDSVTALRVVFATTVGAVFTLPLWIHYASQWITP